MLREVHARSVADWQAGWGNTRALPSSRRRETLLVESLEQRFATLRREMIDQISAHARLVGQETGRERLDPRVMQAMAEIPRHEFVPAELRAFAYFDTPLPIGFEKTISQPFIVALMTDMLELSAPDRVLDVGTGLGYQAAILSRLATSVYSVEIIDELAESARRRLGDLHIDNVDCKIGDGSLGWAEHAPFDKVLVAAAPDLIPISLLNQLRPGGRMVIPAGLEDAQKLMLVTKDDSGQLHMDEGLAVRFLDVGRRRVEGALLGKV